MRYVPSLLIIGLGGVILAVGSVVVPVVGAPTAPPIYTVAQVQRGVQHDPRAWTGRTVRVRAVSGTQYCADRAGRHCVVEIGDAGSLDTPAPLALGTEDAVLSVLRRLPLVGSTMPGPQVLHTGRTAVYRIAVLVHPVCTVRPCSDAGYPAARLLLVDAAPAPTDR